MSDLVERLREPIGYYGINSEDGGETYDPLRLESANEIERLGAMLDYYKEHDAIERVKAARGCKCLHVSRHGHQDDCELLDVEGGDMSNHPTDYGPEPSVSELQAQIFRLEAEIERLRAALKEAEKAAIVGDAPHVIVITRRALKDKPR